jgi:hypothetical protein
MVRRDGGESTDFTDYTDKKPVNMCNLCNLWILLRPYTLRLQCAVHLLERALHDGPGLDTQPVLQYLGVHASEVQVEGQVALHQIVGVNGRLLAVVAAFHPVAYQEGYAS